MSSRAFKGLGTITTVTLEFSDIQPVEFECELDNPVFLDVCQCWADREANPNQVIHLSLGSEESEDLYFPISALDRIQSSVPIPPGHFIPAERHLVGNDNHELNTDASWMEWVEKCKVENRDPVAMYRYMLDQGVREEDIGHMTGYNPSVPLDISEREDRESIYPLQAENIDESFRIQSDYIELYEIPGLVGKSTCEHLLSLRKNDGVRSDVLRPDGLGRSENRTSNTYRFPNAGSIDPVIRSLQNMFSDMIGVELVYAEPMTLLIYQPGQQFRAHQDFFGKEMPGFDSSDGTVRGGQRKWSVLVFLSQLEPGSGTRFHRIRKEFTPTLGAALVWSNVYPSGNPNHYTQHMGLPVGQKGKYVLTQMFRG